jgi:hypothetical protein
MSENTSLLPIVLGALPAIAAFLKLLWPSGDRSLHGTVKRMAETAAALPDGTEKKHFEKELGMMAHELAFRESRRVRRRWEGSSIAAVVFVVLVGGGLTWFLLGTGFIAWQVVGVAVAVFAAALVAAGAVQMRPVKEKYRFEDADQKKK